jgi:hypothetical protein
LASNQFVAMAWVTRGPSITVPGDTRSAKKSPAVARDSIRETRMSPSPMDAAPATMTRRTERPGRPRVVRERPTMGERIPEMTELMAGAKPKSVTPLSKVSSMALWKTPKR